MSQDRKQSTRLWLLIVGIGFAVLKEVMAHYEIRVETDTLIAVEGLILSIAGLDTIRPLGSGKAPKEGAKVEETAVDVSAMP